MASWKHRPLIRLLAHEQALERQLAEAQGLLEAELAQHAARAAACADAESKAAEVQQELNAVQAALKTANESLDTTRASLGDTVCVFLSVFVLCLCRVCVCVCVRVCVRVCARPRSQACG